MSLFAMPKSTIFTSPVNVTTMFCGEMSRWTMPRVRAVEIALVVRVREPGAHAEDDRERVLERELEDVLLLHLTDDRAQVLAVDVLHRDEVLAVGLPDVEDLDDVRMRERRRDARLVEQHLDERAVLVHRRQDPLDDEQLLEACDALLDGEEELRHAAGREPADEGVLAEPTRHAVHPELVVRAVRCPRAAGSQPAWEATTGPVTSSEKP